MFFQLRESHSGCIQTPPSSSSSSLHFFRIFSFFFCLLMSSLTVTLTIELMVWMRNHNARQLLKVLSVYCARRRWKRYSGKTCRKNVPVACVPTSRTTLDFTWCVIGKSSRRHTYLYAKTDQIFCVNLKGAENTKGFRVKCFIFFVASFHFACRFSRDTDDEANRSRFLSVSMRMKRRTKSEAKKMDLSRALGSVRFATSATHQWMESFFFYFIISLVGISLFKASRVIRERVSGM